jgi:hypothetical protein
MMVSPIAVIVALSVLAFLAGLLSIVVLRRYLAQRKGFLLAYAVGLILVTFTLIEEVFFYAGYWSQPLIQSYLFLVAALVGILSLGSAKIGLAARWFRVYSLYIVAMVAIAGWFTFTTYVPSSIIDAGVVTGNPPLAIIISSTLVTVPAAVLMVGVSVLGAIRQHKPQLLLIAAGIVVISAAGALYIVSIPVTLYFAEFLGVLLLFLGFIGVPIGSRASAPRPASEASGGK